MMDTFYSLLISELSSISSYVVATLSAVIGLYLVPLAWVHVRNYLLHDEPDYGQKRRAQARERLNKYIYKKHGYYPYGKPK